MAVAKKPTRLKVIAGTDKRHPERHRNVEPEFSKPKSAVPPRTLCSVGKKKWRELFPLLSDAGVLQSTDLDALERYCHYWSVFQECARSVQTDGSVVKTPQGTRRNPASVAMVEASKEIRAIGQTLGLSPSARASLDVGGKKDKNDFSSRRRK